MTYDGLSMSTAMIGTDGWQSISVCVCLPTSGSNTVRNHKEVTQHNDDDDDACRHLCLFRRLIAESVIRTALAGRMGWLATTNLGLLHLCVYHPGCSLRPANHEEVPRRRSCSTTGYIVNGQSYASSMCVLSRKGKKPSLASEFRCCCGRGQQGSSRLLLCGNLLLYEKVVRYTVVDKGVILV